MLQVFCTNHIIFILSFSLWKISMTAVMAGDEVGSSPEEGPFNAALVQSTCGAVTWHNTLAMIDLAYTNICYEW